VALLVGIVFFIMGYSWYYGQGLLRQYLHCYAQTTALAQLPHRLGFIKNAADQVDNELRRPISLLVEHDIASSDEDELHGDKQTINVLPPVNDVAHNVDEEIPLNGIADASHFRTSINGNVVFSVTPGLGVFLTTSSRHTPHVFERFLARVHAVSVADQETFSCSTFLPSVLFSFQKRPSFSN
jgi:hypothetical protein